jgi:prepilin-type N-terminal cleavage/methylation domain-containing protein
MNHLKAKHSGFTLTEMAIVMVIMALLIGGMLAPLSAQRDIQNINSTQRQLSDIREALLGFAAANGRLPCPASPASTGVENPAGGGACVNPKDGFVPGTTLGIGPTDSQGYALDAWGNRIRYAVTNWQSGAAVSHPNAFTTVNGIASAWNDSAATIVPNLRVCSTSAGISGSACAADMTLSYETAAILISSGGNGGLTPAGADELANTDNNSTFVSHTPTPADAPQGEFDDIVIWLSPNILYSRMISANRLP